ncbi:hypothetical protein AA0Y32_08545 [Georgenia phoenicis]|uniref:hypothetical protein n=1 Tax=unclassified Georgenia TaxID=2626815 RepID=UPI0039AFDF4D
MPREIVILSPTPPDLGALLRAGVAVDGGLRVRTLSGGTVHELCRGDGTGATAVLSVYPAEEVLDATEVARLLPDAPPLPQPLWWTEALAPWDEHGQTGLAVAYELASQLGAACVVQDGT